MATKVVDNSVEKLCCQASKRSICRKNRRNLALYGILQVTDSMRKHAKSEDSEIIIHKALLISAV
jgi:hypothetical protein